MAPQKAKGTVKSFNEEKGFGFITGDDDAKDYFVHYSAIAHGRATLSKGQRVEFGPDAGPKGPVASHVSVL